MNSPSKIIRTITARIIKPVDISFDEMGRAFRLATKLSKAAASRAQIQFLRADSELYGAVVVKDEEGDHPELKEDVPKIAVNEKALYNDLCTQFPLLATKSISCIMRQTKEQYFESRKSIATGWKRPIDQKSYPIRVSGQGTRWRRNEDGDIILRVNVLSLEARLPKTFEVLLSTRNLPKFRLDPILSIVDGKTTAPEIRIVKNKRKNFKGDKVTAWEVRVPVEIQAQSIDLDESRVLYVFPTENEILKAVFYAPTKPGEEQKITDIRGKPIIFDAEKRLENHERRMASVSAKYKQIPFGSGIGRGRQRAILHKSKSHASQNRWKDTRNKQIAAYIIKLAIQQRCATIAYISPSDVYGTNCPLSWEWFNLGQCVLHATQRNGMKFVKLLPADAPSYLPLPKVAKTTEDGESEESVVVTKPKLPVRARKRVRKSLS